MDISALTAKVSADAQATKTAIVLLEAVLASLVTLEIHAASVSSTVQ